MDNRDRIEYDLVKNYFSNFYDNDKDIYLWVLARLEADYNDETVEHQSGVQYVQAEVLYQSLKQTWKLDKKEKIKIVITVMELIINENDEDET